MSCVFLIICHVLTYGACVGIAVFMQHSKIVTKAINFLNFLTEGISNSCYTYHLGNNVDGMKTSAGHGCHVRYGRTCQIEVARRLTHHGFSLTSRSIILD